MKDNKGFTLIELVAVLILIAIFTSISVVKYMNFTNSAEKKAVEYGLMELNTRIHQYWLNVKLSGDEDSELPDFDLGPGYTVTPKRLFKGKFVIKERTNRKGVTKVRLNPNNISIQYAGAKATCKTTVEMDGNTPRYTVVSWNE